MGALDFAVPIARQLAGKYRARCLCEYLLCECSISVLCMATFRRVNRSFVAAIERDDLDQFVKKFPRTSFLAVLEGVRGLRLLHYVWICVR